MQDRLGNYIRVQRKNAGLSQRQLARILGYDQEAPISRHERVRTLPPLLIAIAYCVVFRAPMSDVFSGVFEAVERMIEERLADLEHELQNRNLTSPREAASAKTLDWLAARRMSRPIPGR